MDFESAFDLAMSEAAHLAPEPGTMTVAQAHRVMRQHRRCRRENCELKAAAVEKLSDAGHLRLADSFDRARR